MSWIGIAVMLLFRVDANKGLKSGPETARQGFYTFHAMKAGASDE